MSEGDHESDAELYDRLQGQGFAGPQQEAFEAGLSGYARSVLISWIHGRTIFLQCARIQRAVQPSEAEARDLTSDADSSEREGLADETVAFALVYFRAHALRGGGWHPDGDATLTSFFVGACVQQFPNVFRRWRRGRRQPPTVNYGVDATTAGLRQPTGDPTEAVVDELTGKQEMAKMPPRIRAVAQGIVDGRTYEQIGSELGMTARAVEATWYRYRRSMRGEEGR